MNRYNDKDIQRIKSLRKEGRYSFAALSKMTNIPSNTIRNWCSDQALLGTRWDTLLATNQRTRAQLKASDTSVVHDIEDIDVKQAKLFVSLIYWCEGSKYPSSAAVTLVNSDPYLVKMFITLFKKAFLIQETKLRVHLQIHDDQNFVQLKTYWSKLLSIPEEQFIRPTVTHARGGKHRATYYGTCTIKYHDYRILLKLMGIYEAFVKKFIENLEGGQDGNARVLKTRGSNP